MLVAIGLAGFNPTDAVIVCAGIAALLVVAYFAGRVERDTRDFFLGGRGLPAWAVCLSFIATEISALTIVAVPAAAYRENWHYLQMFIGSAAARFTIAFLFIPVFFKFDCTTIYEYLRHRFGPATHYAASIFFFITRLLASGIRLYVAAMGTALILGWSRAGSDKAGVVTAITAFSLVGIAFIAFGGIKAVVWTNVLQALVFIAGGAATLAYLYHRIDGGFAAISETAGAGGRLSVVNLSPEWSEAQFLPLAVLNGYFVSLAAFGADQDLMQRLLTVNTRRSSQRSLLATIAVGLPVVLLFLSIGTLLYVFYQQNPALPQPAADRTDEILPHFVAVVMPHGLKGLLLLTILMASIDSPLGSLSASFVTDIYRPLIHRTAREEHYLAVSRVSVVAFGVLLGLVAYAASYLDQLLWVAFKILGVTAGSLLGVFLLGLLTRRKGDRGNVAAMIASAVSMAVLLALIEYRFVPLGWTWLILLGTVLTFTLACLFSRNAPPRATSNRSAACPGGGGAASGAAHEHVSHIPCETTLFERLPQYESCSSFLPAS